MGEPILSKAFVQGAPGAAYTVWAGHMLSEYCDKWLDQAGWTSDKAVRPLPRCTQCGRATC